MGNPFENTMHIFAVFFTPKIVHTAERVLLGCFIYSSTKDLSGNIFFVQAKNQGEGKTEPKKITPQATLVKPWHMGTHLRVLSKSY